MTEEFLKFLMNNGIAVSMLIGFVYMGWKSVNNLAYWFDTRYERVIQMIQDQINKLDKHREASDATAHLLGISHVELSGKHDILNVKVTDLDTRVTKLEDKK